MERLRLESLAFGHRFIAILELVAPLSLQTILLPFSWEAIKSCSALIATISG